MELLSAHGATLIFYLFAAVVIAGGLIMVFNLWKTVTSSPAIAPEPAAASAIAVAPS